MFGDHPVAILGDIRHAGTPAALRALNQRARAFALQQLAGAASVDWVAQFLHLADAGIVRRLISTSGDDGSSCWSVCGSSGRAESLTRLAPRIVMITADSCSQEAALATYQHVTAALSDCDSSIARKTRSTSRSTSPPLPNGDALFRLIRDPILKQTYRARPLFDLRPIHGDESLWRSLQNAVNQTVDRDFLTVMANDCLASLPPLTFFQDAVVDESGEESPVFRLERSALRPLVDVGRVFGFAGRRIFGWSTLERLEIAGSLFPEHQTVFREAAETLRIVLWLQGRVGISQGTSGAELPPALVSRHERQLLKSGFRSIHRLLEITAALSWAEAL
jgi:signal-transduction protein with cAMP-binding, CBS, and nucleotidyltransferase domain